MNKLSKINNNSTYLEENICHCFLLISNFVGLKSKSIHCTQINLDEVVIFVGISKKVIL